MNNAAHTEEARIVPLQSVVKRDGATVPFEAEKIRSAIRRAGEATGEFDGDEAGLLTTQVLKVLRHKFGPTAPQIEQIQDVVEQVLISANHLKTARAYIVYREQRQKLRRDRKTLVDVASSVNEYLEQSDWRVNANANQGYSLGGLILNVSGKVIANYWLNHVYPPEVGEAHRDGSIHIHDLDMLSGYCAGWSLRTLLAEGFNGVPGKVEAGPPRHMSSAVGQIVNFLGTLQNEWAGAQAFSSFDTYMAPFVRMDRLSYEEVRQHIQELVFNLNVPSRWGTQTPFTNLTFDWVCPEDLRDQTPVIGGEEMPFTYGSLQAEMDLINRAYIEVMTAGDDKGRVFTFPIPTYNVTRDFDWDDPNLDGLWEMTAKYGVPYFSNFINSDMSPEDARSMCCRLRIDNRELTKRGGGLFGSNPLTGSIGVITINMPRLGYLARSEEEFLARLVHQMAVAKESLETKRKVLEHFTEGNLYPYTKYYLRGIKERFGQYWKNHFSTIGLVGMNEACLNLLGQSIATPAGQEFAKRVLDFMRETLLSYQRETGNNYNLEATPAEGTSYRLAKIDKERYPDIVCANEEACRCRSAQPFYTNSTQLPVNLTDDIFEALDLQDEIQTRYTGGTVFHTYAGERLADPAAVKRLIRRICSCYHLPYLTFTPTFSVCPSHGYLTGEQERCPHCQQECEIYSRVVGYLRPVKQWNLGKQAEFELRQEFRF